MSYSDYNYQSSSNVNSTGGYESAYNQVGYDTSQYSSSDPYSADKTQQHPSQYDYTYADSYSQPSDPAGSAPYFNTSSNDCNPTSNSYTTQGSVTHNSSTGYDASQGYQQSSLYQYSKSAEQDTTATSNNQSYSSSNTGFETSGLYDYSAAGSFSTILKDQYNQPQDSYSYNSTTSQSFEGQEHVSPADYTAQYSKSNEYSVPSNVNNRVSYQYEDTASSLGVQNTQPGGYSNSYSPTGGYPSSQTAGSYQSGLSSSSGYLGSQPSGGYNNNNNNNTQPSADVFQNTQSSGYYSSRSFDTNRNSLNNNFNSNKKDASTYGGFSYSPKKEYGSFHQTERGGFQPQSQSDNYSRSAGTNFSRGRDNFNQRREERGAAITARNFNSPGHMNNNQVTVSTSDNARVFSSNSWRGAKSGSGQLSQNRGGYNNDRNENLNHSYPRGGKFNNHNSRDNRGFSDTGNQFRSQNQSTGSYVDRLGTRKSLGNKDLGSETNSIKTTSYSEPGHQRSPQKNIVDKSAKDEGKAPFYPNQKLLNEIEEKKNEMLKKEKVNTPVEAKMVHQDAVKDLISKKNEEVTEKTTTGQDKNKPTDISLKILAPPSKVPETPEEIAKEEEIQRKIRESIVVVNPDNEKSLLSDDPLKEVEMSDELRDLLKTLTSEHFCKLCTLRMIGPQMATMHYNGKNHLKKVRIFVQTNGRSAGYNMDTLNENDVTDSTKSEEKAVSEEETELDEKKYCKICKVAFSQESQSEMHYKGKNHAKKLRSIANGSEIFECKICCVTVTAQEHLTAHLNGARHKLQIRKMDGDSTHRGGLRGGRGGGGYRGRGGRGGGQSGNGDDDNKLQGQTGFRGRGNGRGRGQNWRGGYGRDGKLITNDEESEKLYDLLGLTPEKRYKFDLANFRTPSGSYYCSSCDIAMDEEPKFMLHLGSNKHYDKVYKYKPKREKNCSFKRTAGDQEFNVFSRNI